MTTHKRIFISHSFDHPEKLIRIQEFIEGRGIRHVDYSVPAWDPINHEDVQSEIEARIRECDRVIVILTEGSHKSEWINQEVQWARDHGKPVIGVWPHGEAGSPVPEVMIEANAHLIGWRATSLEKALNREDVGDYRALVLAEDADFDRAVRRVVAAAGAVSLLLIVHDVVEIRRLVEAISDQGIEVALDPDWASRASEAAKGALVGGMLGLFVGALFGRTPGQVGALTAIGVAVGGGVALHRTLRAEIKQLESLVCIDLEPIADQGN